MSPMFWLLKPLLPPGLYFQWCWYKLTKAEQDEAGRLAVALAKQVHGKELAQLTPEQLRQVHDLVKARFAG